MSTTAEKSLQTTERQPLKHFAEKAYLEYAMYVILDRALPHVGDGLKPVQRRIVYAMDELRLDAGAKYKKSARTVGDVLGKYHPHGDSACYEAMVLMAQPFTCRYPLIDGQGNWGAADDPKSFAAMRYTEARLSRYAEILLEETGQGTVDWVPNFDGTLQEPAVLPSRLPNILLNGGTGIAVGMATDIPPHNLREVVRACIYLLDHPEANESELFAFVPGPDFPTEAEIITPPEDIMGIYRSGTGTIRMRAVYETENGDIVVTALPYQVSGAKVMEQIAAQMQNKKLPMVADLRDESDHEDPTRLVIVPRSNRVDKNVLMDHLFATTDLERSYRVNLNLIGLDGRPCVMGLKSLLSEWLTFRQETVRRRLGHRLAKVRDRLHVLDGLLVAFLNIDEVIALIRSEENPKAALMTRFGLSDAQAEAILSLRLRHLARLEEIKIRAEAESLGEERDRLEKILGSPARLKTLIRRELKADAEAYGDPRRSPIVARREAQALTEADLTPTEPVTVVLSVNGWVRAAKGHEVDPTRLSYKSGDGFLAEARGRSNQPTVFIDSTGRSYAVPAHSLPSARGQGEPMSGRLNMPQGACLVAVLMGEPDQPFLIGSDAGYGFVAVLEDFLTKNRGGKALLSLPEAARPLPPIPLADPQADHLVVVTNQGRMLIFPLSQLPRMTKGKGNQMIGIPPASRKTRVEFVTHMTSLAKGGHLVIHAGKRFLTLKPGNLSGYEADRGRRGRKLPRGFQKVDRVEVVEPSQMVLL